MIQPNRTTEGMKTLSHLFNAHGITLPMYGTAYSEFRSSSESFLRSVADFPYHTTAEINIRKTKKKKGDVLQNLSFPE
jgi:hypothetical protein